MAASAIVALMSTGVGLATGTIAATSFSIFGATLLGAAATNFLITTAMGAALNALTPKPNVGSTRGYSLAGESGPALDHQIIYGRTRVGGVRIYDASTGGNNDFLHRILAFAGHEVESYDEIYLNDEVVTLDGSGNVTSPSRYNGFVRIKKYFGTTVQTADADLVSETSSLAVDAGRWTTDHRLQGIAYLYVRFKYNQDAFPNGVPAVSATIKGKKVYNPATTTTAWSDNPALCLRDYLSSSYGLAQPDARIDDVGVTAAANICNQLVSGEKRYTCNGSFVTSFNPSQIISDLLTSMGGLFWYSQGKWRMKAAAYVTPTVTLDEDDLRSGISLSTRHSRRSNFNKVKGTFRGSESDWQVADYPAVTDAAFLAADNNIESIVDVPLPFTSDSVTAQRLANIFLRRNREQLTFSASFGLKAFQVEVGDFVYINNTRFGWTNKPFEVTNWTFGLVDGLDLQVQMTLREISSAVFTLQSASVFENNNTTLPNPFTGLAVSGLTASGGGNIQGDGTFVNATILSWTAVTNVFVSGYEIEWKPVSDSSYSSATSVSSSIELSPIIDGISYVYRVRAVGSLGNKGPFTSITFTSGGDVTAPSPPTNVSAEAGYKYLAVKFDLPTAADFNRVEVYESATSSFAAAVSVGFTSGNRFIRTGLSNNVTRYYWVRSEDFSGNLSNFVGPVNATTFLVGESDLTQDLIDTIEAAGVEAVNSLPASGAFDGQIVFLLTDSTLYRWKASTSSWTTELFTGIKDGAITETKIASGSISTPKLQANSVTATQISAGSVVTDKLAASAVVASKIAAGAVTADKISVSELSAITAVIGTFASANTGARLVIEDDKISVYDASNVLRVRVGNLA